MDARGIFVADWIAQIRRPLAAGAATRLQASRPELVSEIDARALEGQGFPGLAADAEIRLEFLGQALAAGRPALLADHLIWLKIALGARGFTPVHVRAPMVCLADELRDSLPTEHADLAAGCIEAALSEFDDAPAGSETLLTDGLPLVELTRRYLLAVLEGRRDDAESLVLDAVDAGTPPDDLERHVLMRCQHEIGRLWQVGDLHAAEEHFASRVAEGLTTLLRRKLPRGEPRGLRLLVASVGGNDHDLAARMLSDRFEIAGWSTILLGANCPSFDIARSVIDFDADLVALSTSLSLHVRATSQVCAAVRALPTRSSTPILVGGRPFEVVPDLYEVVGADGTAVQIEDALAIAERLVAAPHAG